MTREESQAWQQVLDDLRAELAKSQSRTLRLKNAIRIAQEKIAANEPLPPLDSPPLAIQGPNVLG